MYFITLHISRFVPSYIPAFFAFPRGGIVDKFKVKGDIMNRIHTLLFLVVLGLSLVSCGRKSSQKEVVVYTAHDQVYSEPIFTHFQEKTGIVVKPVYDTEAVKSVGLVRRIVAERNSPRCDVFWNNEIARTMVLKKEGLLQPFLTTKPAEPASIFIDDEGYWRGFAARLRVIVYNTSMLNADTVPKSVMDFAKPEWKGKLTMAYPLFGTTEIHCAALRVAMGEAALDLFKGIIGNEVAILDGNAQVVNMVARGEYAAGLTDTDDAWSAKNEGKSVDFIFPDADGIGALLIPNTVAMIKDCPHPEEARVLIDYLVSDEAQTLLAQSPAAQVPIDSEVRFDKSAFKDAAIKVMTIDYEKVADELEGLRPILKDIFSR